MNAAHDLWAATCLFAWISILVLLHMMWSYQSQTPLRLPLVGWVGLFLFELLFSARFSWDVNTTRTELWIWTCTAAIFFLSCNIFHHDRSRHYFLCIGPFLLVPLSIDCLYQQLTRHALGTAGQFYLWGLHVTYGHWEINGTLVNSVILAGFTLAWILVAYEQSQKNKYFYIPLCCGILILLLARSWWSYFCLCLGLVYYHQDSALAFSRRHKILTRVIFTAATVISVFILYFKFGPHQSDLYKGNDRWYWWATGVRMALEHPWTGIGLGGYSAAFPFFKFHAGQNTRYAHSFAIQILAETGIPGFICLGALFAAFFYYFSTKKHRPSSPFSHERMALATVLMLICFSSITLSMDYFLSKLMLVIFMGFALAEIHVYEMRVTQRGILLITLAILLCIPSWELPFRASQYTVNGLQQMNDPESAEMSFKYALSLDPYQTDSLSALSRLNAQLYAHSRSLLDWSYSILWFNEASLLQKTTHETIH